MLKETNYKRTSLITEWLEKNAVSTRIIVRHKRKKPAKVVPNFKSSMHRRVHDQAVKYMLEEGAIQKHEGLIRCENRTFVIAKSNGDPRFILDGSNVNNFLEAPKFQLPGPCSILAKPASFAAKLDLTNAFLSFNLDPQLQPYTVFRDSRGVAYSWKKLPWGLSAAPAICQFMLEPVLEAVKKKFGKLIQAYLFYDDMIVLSPNRDSCRQATLYLLDLLEKLNVSINFEKSIVEPQTNIDWLGVRVVMDPTNPHKIRITNTEEKKQKLMTRVALLDPSKHKEGKVKLKHLLSFLGLAGFMASIVKIVRKMVIKLLVAIPADAVSDKASHKKDVLITKRVRGLARKIAAILQGHHYMEFVLYKDRTFEVFVDASLVAGGISNRQGTAQATLGFGDRDALNLPGKDDWKGLTKVNK